MSQINGMLRAQGTCARAGCNREAPDATLCWKHQLNSAHATSPSARVGHGLSPSSHIARDGDRKAKRTRTGLFTSSSVPASARCNGTLASGRDTSLTHPKSPMHRASAQPFPPPNGAPGQSTIAGTVGSPVMPASPHLEGPFKTYAGPHPKASPPVTSNAPTTAPNSTNQGPFHQRTAPSEINSQRTPGPSRSPNQDMTETINLSNPSRWFQAAHSTPYFRPTGGDASLTFCRDAAPRPPECKTTIAREGDSLNAGVARLLQRPSGEELTGTRGQNGSFQSWSIQSPRLRDIIDLTGDSDDSSSAHHELTVSRPPRQPRATSFVSSTPHEPAGFRPTFDQNALPEAHSSFRGFTGASSTPTRSQTAPQPSQQSEAGSSVSSHPLETTADSTKLNEAPRLARPVNVSDQNSTDISQHQVNHGGRRTEPIIQNGSANNSTALLPEKPAVNTSTTTVPSVAITASPKKISDSTSQGPAVDKFPSKLPSNTLPDGAGWSRPLQVHQNPPNATLAEPRGPNQASNLQAGSAPEGLNNVVDATRDPFVSNAEVKRRARVAQFDSSAFDSQIYAQEHCLAPPQGVILDRRKSTSSGSNHARQFLYADPAIHGMHARSQEWYERKALEIQRRPHRKFWFGKVNKRLRWLRIQENRSHKLRNRGSVIGPSPFRKEPQPWSYRRPIDFGDVPENELPADVRENPAWEKACERFRQNKATKVKMEEAYLREKRASMSTSTQRKPAQQRTEHNKQNGVSRQNLHECGDKHRKKTVRQEMLYNASQEVQQLYEQVRTTWPGKTAPPGHFMRK